MGRMISHADAEELLGAYALDAVDPDEAEAIESHLETCPRCRDELRNHREVVGVLAHAGHEAPAGLWDRVMAGIHDPGPLEGGADQAIPGPTPQLRLVPTVDRATSPAQVTRLRRRTRIVSVAAAAAVLVMALLGVQAYRLQNRTNHLSNQLKAMSAQPTMAVVTAALKEPGVRTIELRSLTRGDSSLDAVITPSGQGYLYDSRLTPLNSAETYQLWGVVGSNRISYGVIGSTPAGVVSFRASSGVQALAVTAEVAGGVVSTTQTPVVFGSLD